MSKSNRTSIGPHEGRELELMLNGKKPLSMFVEPFPTDADCFPERQFDALASGGKFVKYVAIEEDVSPAGEAVKIRTVLYALPAEEWRIKAMLAVQEIYSSLLPGFRPDLERVIGNLLGYDRADVEGFIRSLQER